MKRIAALLVTPLLMACAGEPAQISDPATVIASSRVFAFDDLPADYRASLPARCCSYSNGGWDSASHVPFALEDGFFVELVINRNPLINLTYVQSCPGVRRTELCTARDLAAKLQTENFAGPRLYGKYRSSWQFRSGDTPMPATEKFEGHPLLVYQPRGDKDLLLIGPLPMRPTEVEIEIFSGSPRGNPRATLASEQPEHGQQSSSGLEGRSALVKARQEYVVEVNRPRRPGRRT